MIDSDQDYDLEIKLQYFRGVSREDLKEILKTGKLKPSSDLMVFDGEVLEYAIGEEYSIMTEEQIDSWIKDVVYWYDGSEKSVRGGVNLTTDFENAKGYGDYVVATNADTSDVADVSDSHSFARKAEDVNVTAIYDVNKDRWIRMVEPVHCDDV